ncbi:methyltransferase [Marinomonas piezotolerans]|uniref:Methyltransferase n=1 Tax=Marinomonas piezotolerans TaxID=2213058 RepID=A0A370U7K9_9GAMM|nr:methyltransferase [Marinomonas piezotolerans]RDL43780.1 methyltransferase [Marinomonas piezotolerans]
MSSSFSTDFSVLDGWLAQNSPLWNIQSFQSLDWPWRTNYPELCNWLDAITHVPDYLEVEQALQEHVVGFTAVPKVTFDAPLEKTLHPPLPSYVSQGIKGRKWQQILAFSECTQISSPVIEWCAGKGHLGKVLALQQSAHVHSLEWQQSLCDSGADEAHRLGIAQTFTCADVLQGDGNEPLLHANSAVALHACGDLHRVLIEQGIAARLDQMAISPCCYHLTQDRQYRPLSKQGQQANTQLNQDNLKLAVKEVATAGQREQRLKALELTYRLGFDAWQRQARGVDQYLNVPSCPKRLLNEGFAGFCDWAAQQKGLQKQLTAYPIKGFEQIGEQRRQRVEILEAITQYFRRPLEYWLVLDRALCLEEAGYQVAIGVFCEPELTPRNLMIKATK